LDGSDRYDPFNSRDSDSNDIFTQTLHVGNGKLPARFPATPTKAPGMPRFAESEVKHDGESNMKETKLVKPDAVLGDRPTDRIQVDGCQLFDVDSRALALLYLLPAACEARLR
jgi:hypothetical protein